MPRYIDADALKSRMLNYYDCVNQNTSKGNYRGETLMAYEVADMIEDCIDNAPTADVAEVRRGAWKKVNEKYPRYVCTACNHLFNNEEYRYCSHCGARMGRRKGKQ